MDLMTTLSKGRTYAPKDALAIDGRVQVKQGRGRMAADAIARIHELVAEGYSIKGYVSSSTPATKDAPKEVKRIPVSNEKVIADYILTHDEKFYRAMDSDGKAVGMREVCNNCRVSLVQCHCDNPTILGDIAVKIVPRV